MNYKNCGVDIQEKKKALQEIEKDVNSNVLSQFGDFAGMIRFGNKVLVTSTVDE